MFYNSTVPINVLHAWNSYNRKGENRSFKCRFFCCCSSLEIVILIFTQCSFGSIMKKRNVQQRILKTVMSLGLGDPAAHAKEWGIVLARQVVCLMRGPALRLVSLGHSWLLRGVLGNQPACLWQLTHLQLCALG